MTQVQTTIATAADYADAMITARRAKKWLFALLLLILLGQLAIFFVAAFSHVLDGAISPAAVVSTSPALAVEAGAPTTAPVGLPVTVTVNPQQSRAAQLLEYVIGATTFLGMGASIVLAVVLLLLVLIMLIGRLIGVSRVTAAFIWCVILAVMLFPWQAFFNYPGLAGADFRIPGVLYTWSELAPSAKFWNNPNLEIGQKILGWSRFVGFPLVALILLLIVHTKSGRGLKLALGEADADVTGTDRA